MSKEIQRHQLDPCDTPVTKMEIIEGKAQIVSRPHCEKRADDGSCSIGILTIDDQNLCPILPPTNNGIRRGYLTIRKVKILKTIDV